MFMGIFTENQLFSGPIPEELGKLEKLTVLATGRLSLFYYIYVAVVN